MLAIYPCIYHITGDVGDDGSYIDHKGMTIMEESTRTVRFVLTEDLSLIAAEDDILHEAIPHPEAGAFIYNPEMFPRLVGVPI